MTPDQISLVQSSFERLAPQADAVARAFYDRLFAIDPALRALFPADLTAQRGKLMQMLGAAVQGLGDVPTLLPVVAAHYATVGQALMDTLRSGLGTAYTPPLAQAWSAVYTALAGAMQAGAGASAPERVAA